MITEAQRSELKAEIETDPMRLGYKGYSPETQKLINEVGLSGEVVMIPITIPNLEQWLVGTGLLDVLYQQQTAHPDRVIRSICRGALRLIDRADILELDFSDPALAQMIGALEMVGILPKELKDDLDTKITRPASRAEVLFGRGVVVDYYDIIYTKEVK